MSKNSNPQRPPPGFDGGAAFATPSDKLVLVMVGLPARGKSYISRRLMQYLAFFHGASAQVFNVGQYRRQLLGNFQEAAFFDPKNTEGVEQRRALSERAMQDMKEYISSTTDMPGIAIFDATNSTAARRNWILDALNETGVKVIFIESIFDDETIVEDNINSGKLGGQDYAHLDADQALADFQQRIDYYKTEYETITEKSQSWIKLIDGGRNIVLNNIQGYLPSRIAQFLMNLHMQPHTFYFSRHGQSEYNLLGKIGGDSGLTEDGEKYAVALAEWVETNVQQDQEGNPLPARLWTSSMQRTIRTGRHIGHPRITLANGQDFIQMRPKVMEYGCGYLTASNCALSSPHMSSTRMPPFLVPSSFHPLRPLSASKLLENSTFISAMCCVVDCQQFRALDEIYAGICDGMTYEDIQAHYPDEFVHRKQNKLTYRYPRGESYLDLIQRLEPIAHEMERQREPLLIVAHQAILRVLYAYFMAMPRDAAPKISIPLNTVIRLNPSAMGCAEERFKLHELTSEPPSH